MAKRNAAAADVDQKNGSLAVTYRPLSVLIPYARNARTHSQEQVAQIAASMKEFGWTNPVLIDGAGGIIAGHGRVLAAQALGLEQAPCIELGAPDRGPEAGLRHRGQQAGAERRMGRGAAAARAARPEGV